MLFGSDVWIEDDDNRAEADWGGERVFMLTRLLPLRGRGGRGGDVAEALRRASSA